MSVIQSARLGANRRASRTCKRSLSGTHIGPGLLLRTAFEKPESASVALTATAEDPLSNYYAHLSCIRGIQDSNNQVLSTRIKTSRQDLNFKLYD